MGAFLSCSGVVTSIDPFWADAQEPSGCFLLMSVRRWSGDTVNFVMSPDTYLVGHTAVRIRDTVTGFYDPNAPTPMIFPPQYRALVIAENVRNQTVAVDFFDSRLVSGDGTLRLNLSRSTRVILPNGQTFVGELRNRNLAVVYRASGQNLPLRMMGVPAQITPLQVTVLC